MKKRKVGWEKRGNRVFIVCETVGGESSISLTYNELTAILDGFRNALIQEAKRA